MTPTIESRDFHEVMQQYRHMPLANQSATVSAYKNVIKLVDDKLKPMVEALTTSIEFYEFWATQTKSDDERENFVRLAKEAHDAIAAVMPKE